MEFLNLTWALAGLLAVPIILLYLLKMRRRPTEISSTLLWEQVLADLRANTPFQKLRRNLLLILQLLTLALLVTALMQPVIQATGLSGSDSVVIVDGSPSMQAVDEPGGPTRFARAVEQAGKLVDSLTRGDRMMLIVAGPPGRGVRTAFTGDKTELRDVLRSAKAMDSPAAMDDALGLAVATLADRASDEMRGKVFLFSDGVNITLPDVPALAQALRYVRIGETGRNVGITSLSVEPRQATTQPAAGGQAEVTAAVKNFSAAPAEVTVSFFYGRPDHWIDSQQLSLAGGASQTVALRKDLPPGKLWIRLTQPGGDALALDDVGYVLLPERKLPRVTVVSAGNRVLRDFLRVGQQEGMLEGQWIAPTDYKGGQEKPADLTIVDDFVPRDLPAGDVLLIRPPSSAAGFERLGQADWPVVTNARTEADVLRLVNLADFAVARADVYRATLPATELIASDRGPLLAYTQRGGDRRYLLAFHLPDSTWATEAGFLVFLGNVLERSRQAHYVGVAQLLATGGAARLGDVSSPAEQTEVIDPHSERHALPAGMDSFADTHWAGFYAARAKDGTTSEFVANLLSPQQSNISPRPLTRAAGQTVEQQTEVVRTNRPIWPILAIAALALLLVEWYCYHRRVG